MAQQKNISVNVGLDMQSYYDNLVLYRDSINAQIKVLEASPDICTHKRTKDIGDGVIICVNHNCNKVISSGIYDNVKTT